MFVDNQRGIQRRGQDFDKSFNCHQYVERLVKFEAIKDAPCLHCLHFVLFAILNTENMDK